MKMKMTLAFEINGQKIELNEEEARELYSELSHFFNNKTVCPQMPYKPWAPSPYDELYKIIC